MDRKVKRELVFPTGISQRQVGELPRLQIAFTFKGHECRELLAPTKTITQSAIDHAHGKRLQILAAIKDNKFVYGEFFPTSRKAAFFDVSGKRIMLRDKLDEQLRTYEQMLLNERIALSTFKGYKKSINSARMHELDKYSLTELTPSILRAWIGDMNVTDKRVRNLLTPLHSTLQDAVNDDLIVANPFDRVALNKILKQSTVKSEYKVEPFNADERAALLKACRADERPFIAFWMNTGLRTGEMIALRWDRIDWVGSTAHIDLNVVEKTEKGPKTESGVRDVDLNAEALAALDASKASSFLQNERIFLNPRTGQAWETDTQIRKTLWISLCKRAGVRQRTPYNLRHTFASALLTAGVNPFYIAQQLGHKDVSMVFRVYGKFISKDYQKPVAAMPETKEQDNDVRSV